MAELLSRLLLAAVLLISAADSQKIEGEDCVYTSTGQNSVCRLLSNCPLILEWLTGRGIPLVICSYKGTVPVVCCPPAGGPIPAEAVPTVPPAVTPTIPSTTPAAELAPRVGPPSTECPPLPDIAFKVQKTGQKAWDKCIDLAELVQPCISFGFQIYGSKTRRDTCKRVAKPLIVGGNSTEEGEFPHMAALGHGDEPNILWLCGGTLISELWILTAGHCTYHKLMRTKVKHAMLGGLNIDSPIVQENYYTIAKIVPHSDYDPSLKYNDIALLQLDRTVKMSAFVRPACLHTGQPVKDEKVIATGWGVTRSRGDQSKSLLKVTLEKFSHAECALKLKPTTQTRYGIINSTQTCYGYRNESRDTCQGDSGGPIQVFNDDNVYCTYLIVGVTSFGRDCGVAGRPGIYTRVATFVPWIESVVWP